MSDETFRYTGSATLEALGAADNYNSAIEDLIRAIPGATGRVLDVGAGTGEFSRRLRDGGAQVTCVEPDPALRGLLVGSGFVAHASIEDAIAPFDLITMVNVLEHIEADVEALRQLRSRLSPDGRIFVFVPSLQVLYSRFDRAIGHHRRYSRAALREALEQAGFVVDSLRSFDSLGIPTALAFRLTRQVQPSRRAVRLYDRWAFPFSHRVDRLLGAVAGKNVYATASTPRNASDRDRTS